MNYFHFWLILFLAFLAVYCEEHQEVEISTSTSPPPSQNKCYRQPPSACPLDGVCRCSTVPNDDAAVICCNVTSAFSLKESFACLCNAEQCNKSSIRRMHIYKASLDEFNIKAEGVESHFKSLESISITDGKINKITGIFSKHTSIKCFNLSNNALNSVDKRTFVNLQKLSLLDLSFNNLSEVPNFRKTRPIQLDISNNSQLMCRSLMDAMNNTELSFIKESETYCLFPKTFHWFNTTEKIPLKQVKTYNEIEKKSCSDNCTCKAQRLDLIADKEPTFAVMVDCSGKEMMEMPTNLPNNTIALNISNNNISELRIDNAIYANIRELYADNNQITSILSLEGTKFIDNFVALSLRNNKLKFLPTYMLSNIFDRNSIQRSVHLGLNKLHCDCNTAKVLKVWLSTKAKNIPDYDEIMCENLENLKVIKLDHSKICYQDQQDWTDYIYYIITAEVLLLVCLVLKVSYDYWVFKTAGYLPWPASKMPKLPCDWLCE